MPLPAPCPLRSDGATRPLRGAHERIAPALAAVANLNYRHLAVKIMGKSWRFFTCVVYLQCTAAFSRATYAPVDVSDVGSGLQVVPSRHAWLFRPWDVSVALDAELAVAYNRSETARPCGTPAEWCGWSRSEAWIGLVGTPGNSAVALQRVEGTRRQAGRSRIP